MDPNHSGIGIGIGIPAGADPTRIPPPRGYALSGKLMLSAIVVLFTVVLLILFIHLYVRWHVYRRESRRSRRRRRNPLIFASGDHVPSSLATPRGLDPKVLNSLAVVIFSSNDGDEFDDESDADVAAECAVCLNEFEDGEKVRVLPRCNHRFHIGCIDMWFGSHNSCPLCRSPVEIESPPPPAEEESESPPPPPPPPPQCAARSSESSSDSADGEVSVEIRGGEGELGLGFGSGPASGQKSRILAIMRFLSRDPRLSRGEADLELGEGAVRTPPPPPAAE